VRSQDSASEQFDNVIPRVAYEKTLGADGRGLAWTERTTQGELRYDTEPGTSWLQRMGVEWMSMLPIEWLLWAMATPDRSALGRARTAIA
jgi:putative cardiolipin synthase